VDDPVGPQSGTHSTWLKATMEEEDPGAHLLSEALGANQFGQHKGRCGKVDLNREFL